ncbi:MAG: penicillin-binding protein 1A [Gammaproteobacteria bacterium]
MLRAARLIIIILLVTSLLTLAVAAGGVWYLAPKLPATNILKDVHLQVPLRVYSRDERLIAEFGEKRRIPLALAGIPQAMINAILAAEDERFFTHPGVDWQGLARAVYHLLRTGEKGPGGSTITMQMARNFFLGRERTYLRKLNEILLALKIERELTKPEILQLYLNKIFLGHRAYGVGAAAQTYYGRELGELSLAQIAMIAGLPKAPSRFNPIADPARALTRRNYVLRRMYELAFINLQAYEEARRAPITASLHGLTVQVEAPYVAEMVRSEMERRFGVNAYTVGLRVYTTIDSRRQTAANRALRKALVEYDERHGYRGPEDHIEYSIQTRPQAEQTLTGIPTVGGLEPALVIELREQVASVLTKQHGLVEIRWNGLSWARPFVDHNRRGAKLKAATEILSVGDVIRVRKIGEEWHLSQVPEVEGALLAMNPLNGAVVALVGGFDFVRSKFNRATQAHRQPGSSFKPFVYSAAIDHGFTAASMINDAPIVFEDPGLEASWRPENYSGEFFGPTRLREALVHSRNLVSIRLLQAIGIDYAIGYLQRFGFKDAALPRSLSLALGSGTLTPQELATAYCVFANGGYAVDDYFIDALSDASGERSLQASPRVVCDRCDAPGTRAGEETRLGVIDETKSSTDNSLETSHALEFQASKPAPRVVTSQNAWIMSSMLRDVIQRGTGKRARVLGRKDIAGKTGTTNDQRDAWFAGFNPRLVAVAWVGFDRLQPLGDKETGSRAALPMWLEFMQESLRGTPEEFMEQPEGMITIRIDPETGHFAGASQPRAIFETFRINDVPAAPAKAPARANTGRRSSSGGVAERLF